MNSCPCGSGSTYENCCQPLINGARQAETAEQLMRSRYSAYVKVETDYILETTHPEHRQNFDPEGTRQWLKNLSGMAWKSFPPKKGGLLTLLGRWNSLPAFVRGVRERPITSWQSSKRMLDGGFLPTARSYRPDPWSAARWDAMIPAPAAAARNTRSVAANKWHIFPWLHY